MASGRARRRGRHAARLSSPRATLSPRRLRQTAAPRPRTPCIARDACARAIASITTGSFFHDFRFISARPVGVVGYEGELDCRHRRRAAARRAASSTRRISSRAGAAPGRLWLVVRNGDRKTCRQAEFSPTPRFIIIVAIAETSLVTTALSQSRPDPTHPPPFSSRSPAHDRRGNHRRRRRSAALRLDHLRARK